MVTDYRRSIGFFLRGLLPGFLFLVSSTVVAAGFSPPQNLNPQSATIRLGSTYQDDAWLVYTYDIDASGSVVNAQIRSSNGVTRVENAVLGKLGMMRFKPATRNGNPVKVSADPVVFTWILDLPREMSPRFSEIYQTAWAHFKQEDYDAAFDQAAILKDLPGRNAFEEVKFQILAASLATRWEDYAAELQHLGRAVELQSLARKNNFKHHYIEPGQYLSILERIQTLQLERMMLADAATTLTKIQADGAGSEIAVRAAAAYTEAEARFIATPEVTVSGELVPIYRDGPGSWKTGLSRDTFAISQVKGTINAVFLICAGRDVQLPYPSYERWTIPVGMNYCKLDVAGKPGTRFILSQFSS